MPDKLAWGQGTLKLWGIKRLEAYPTAKIRHLFIERSLVRKQAFGQLYVDAIDSKLS